MSKNHFVALLIITVVGAYLGAFFLKVWPFHDSPPSSEQTSPVYSASKTWPLLFPTSPQLLGAVFPSVIRAPTPTTGPADTIIPHKEPGVIGETPIVGDLEDFSIEAEFINPLSSPEDSWSYGFILRASDANKFLAVIITRDGDLVVRVRKDEGSSKVYGQFSLPDSLVDINGGGSNLLQVVIIGNQTWFFVNRVWIGSALLNDISKSGEISLFNGYFDEDQEYDDIKVKNVIIYTVKINGSQ